MNVVNTHAGCGGLNKHGPHRPLYLNAWASVSGTIWGGDLPLMRRCHWSGLGGFKSLVCVCLGDCDLKFFS